LVSNKFCSESSQHLNIQSRYGLLHSIRVWWVLAKVEYPKEPWLTN
jgi:hypothetical protein